MDRSTPFHNSALFSVNYIWTLFSFMKLILAELLTIGDEILYGQIVDTNSQWMSVALDHVGIKVVRKTTVGDSEDEILAAFERCQTLDSGKLGPAHAALHGRYDYGVLKCLLAELA